MPRPSDIEDLERAAALHWQAPEPERLGDWLLRAAEGFTGRANSALPLGDPGVPLPEAVAAVAGLVPPPRPAPDDRRAQGPAPGRSVPVPWKIFWPNEAGYPAPAPPSS